MAVNQVSLFFYAPRWAERRIASHLQSAYGGPVYIVDAVRNSDASAPTVEFERVAAWLRARGFTTAEWGDDQIFQQGSVRSIFGPEKEIEISENVQVGELSSLYCRYTLTHDSHARLADWAQITVSLCQAFRLRLGADGSEPCSEQEFRTAVQRYPHWQEWASRYDWERPTA